jgi:hypothetical protein
VTNGIGFRLRFLSKSHLPAKSIEDQVYACIFCIQSGRTTEESDGTVFFNQKSLFAHLARHPRPLPVVAGLTVVEGAEVPPSLKNNYDLHFSNPPIRSLIADAGQGIYMLPTATAVETLKPIHGSIRLPPDHTQTLQFAAGAKIVGIEFPAKYGGEWCVGWADNVRAAFPADYVRLEPPVLRMQGTTNRSAVARWKWSPKDKKEQIDWLRFDKGDVITNINCKRPLSPLNFTSIYFYFIIFYFKFLGGQNETMAHGAFGVC